MFTTRRSSMKSLMALLRNPGFAAPALLLVCCLLTPGLAHAAGISIPFIQDFGCSIVQWLKGPLAILIFILVCVATLVIGMITKMDWARIISVCVIFGIVIGLGTILNSSAAIQSQSGMSSCLQ